MPKTPPLVTPSDADIAAAAAHLAVHGLRIEDMTAHPLAAPHDGSTSWRCVWLPADGCCTPRLTMDCTLTPSGVARTVHVRLRPGRTPAPERARAAKIDRAGRTARCVLSERVAAAVREAAAREGVGVPEWTRRVLTAAACGGEG